MFSPFQSSGQPPRPVGAQLYRGPRLQDTGGGITPSQAPAQNAPGSMLMRAGQFQGGPAQHLLTQSFNQPFSRIGQPGRRDYNASPFVF